MAASPPLHQADAQTAGDPLSRSQRICCNRAARVAWFPDHTAARLTWPPPERPGPFSQNTTPQNPCKSRALGLRSANIRWLNDHLERPKFASWYSKPHARDAVFKRRQRGRGFPCPRQDRRRPISPRLAASCPLSQLGALKAGFMSVLIWLLVVLLFGFACGYAVRASISRRRRAAERKRHRSYG
jgi:hypothetical protein